MSAYSQAGSPDLGVNGENLDEELVAAPIDPQGISANGAEDKEGSDCEPATLNGILNGMATQPALLELSQDQEAVAKMGNEELRILVKGLGDLLVAEGKIKIQLADTLLVLRSTTTTINKMLDRMVEEATERKDRLLRAKEEIAQLKTIHTSKIQESEEKIKDMEAQIQESEEKIKDMEAQIQESEEKIKDMEKQVQESQQRTTLCNSCNPF